MIFAFYGRINSAKDTAAALLFTALTYRKSGASRESCLTQKRLDIMIQVVQNQVDRDRFIDAICGFKDKPFRYIKFTTFSARIHEMTSLLTGVPLEQCLDRNYKDTLVPQGFNKTIRQIMIDIGEGLRASYGPDVWIAPVINFISAHPEDVVLITGMRHVNEYNALRSIGKTTFIRVQSDFEVVKGAEAAEGLLDEFQFDFCFKNQKDKLEILWESVVNMVYSLEF